MSTTRPSRLSHTAVTVAVAAILATAAVRPAAPQAASTFTAEQVERGHALYARNCQDCHGTTLDNGEFGGPAIKGFYFRQKWAPLGAGALYSFTKGLMPPDRPGQLTDQSYIDLMAFILSNNGYTPGDKELTADVIQGMSIKP